MTEQGYGKLNLTLDILRKREDGYHDLSMVMQSVALSDTITMEKRQDSDITVKSDSIFLPSDATNLAWKAVEAFFREMGLPPTGYDMTIEKKLPVSAGMAGGSTDAAAVLRLLRKEHMPQLSRERLEEIGAGIGSDVPYCVRSSTALAEGRGELLTDLPSMPPCTILLCKPDFPISTPELFSLVKATKIKLHPDTRGMMKALSEGDLDGICHRIYNVFEEVLPKKYSAVFEIKQTMLQMDAMAACMTGSGPTVFGIYEQREKAERAAEVLKRSYCEVYVTEPFSGDFFSEV